MAAVKGQCHTLLGRLEVMGPGTAAAAGWKEGGNQGSGAEVEEGEAGNAPEQGFALLDYVTVKEQYKNLLILFGCHAVAALIAVNLDDS